MAKNNNNLIIGVVIVIVILILLGSFGFGSRSYMMNGYNSGFMLFGWIFNILIIILIILGIFWLIKNVNFNNNSRRRR